MSDRSLALALVVAAAVACGCSPATPARMDLGAVTIRPVNIEIAIDAKSRAIRLSDRIRFGRWRRRTRLARSAYAVLDDVAAYLRKHPDIVQVEIQGHTDARGRAAQKLRLSQQRAEVVKQYLVKKGIDAKRLRVKGFGGTRPVASNRTRAGRARNSRIEFHILGERGRSGASGAGAGGGGVGAGAGGAAKGTTKGGANAATK